MDNWTKRLLQAGRIARQWLLAFIISLLSGAALASPLGLGPDIPYVAMADHSGQQSLEQAYAALRQQDSLQTRVFTRGYSRLPYWLHFRLSADVFAGRELWAMQAPNFVDDIRFFYRPEGSEQAWQEKRIGDVRRGDATEAGGVGDLDYRYPVVVFPPPPSGSEGYEVVVRIASTSTLLFQLMLWEPQEFLQYATRTSSFWAFYFGLAIISTLLAMILAVLLKSRRLWSITAMSSAFVLVACIQGYVGWLWPGLGLTLQHYLTGFLALLAHAALLWMSTEVMQLRQKKPMVHKIIAGVALFIVVLTVLIPLDLYQEAVYIQSAVYLFAGSLFVFSCLNVWWKERFRPSSLILGLSPLTIMLASLSGLISILGWIEFSETIYKVWQYGLIVNVLLVISATVFQVYNQHLDNLNKIRMAEELRREREARVHQRHFMGVVAHELRTPLAIITASLENLRQIASESYQTARRYEKIGRATERLIQLTDNCLADARLSAGQLVVEHQPCSLLALIDSAASLIAVSDHHEWRLTREGVAVTATEGGKPRTAADVVLEVDPALMRIAFSNVIDNAAKYSDGGTIHVDIALKNDGWAISISDQGSGIPVDRMGDIFECYRRGDKQSGKSGVGLGLYISRQIARAHGGELTLAKSTESGCRFVFMLPII